MGLLTVWLGAVTIEGAAKELGDEDNCGENAAHRSASARAKTSAKAFCTAVHWVGPCGKDGRIGPGAEIFSDMVSSSFFC